MKKVIAVLAIAGILGIAIVSLPEHISASSSHDGCEICQFFNHPPTLQIENNALTNPINLQGWLSPVTTLVSVLESKQASQPSRAPPSFFNFNLN
jgi:hypothetical protein